VTNLTAIEHHAFQPMIDMASYLQDVSDQQLELMKVENQLEHMKQYLFGVDSDTKAAQRIEVDMAVIEVLRDSLASLETPELSASDRMHQLCDSLEDVNVIVDIIVKKFCHGFSLRSLHQRHPSISERFSRNRIVTYIERIAVLLAPVHQAQLQRLLNSATISIDAQPLKAGRKSKNGAHEAWYWPLYGSENELSFVFSPLSSRAHLDLQLEVHSSGTPLIARQAAQRAYAKRLSSLDVISRESALSAASPISPREHSFAEPEIDDGFHANDLRRWQFSWGEMKVQHVGILQSLVSTCELQSISPHTYLLDVLNRIAVHPTSRMHELTPRHWALEADRESVNPALWVL